MSAQATFIVGASDILFCISGSDKPRLASEGAIEDGEDGEEMDATNDDDAAMMAMMGLTGFGTTKVRAPALHEAVLDNIRCS